MVPCSICPNKFVVCSDITFTQIYIVMQFWGLNIRLLRLVRLLYGFIDQGFVHCNSLGCLINFIFQILFYVNLYILLKKRNESKFIFCI